MQKDRLAERLDNKGSHILKSVRASSSASRWRPAEQNNTRRDPQLFLPAANDDNTKLQTYFNCRYQKEQYV